jgi:hypothetical protein
MTDPLAEIKARDEVLADWHETYETVTEDEAERARYTGWKPAPSPMRRCRQCGAAALDYPEIDLEHTVDCPVPPALAAGGTDHAWLIGEVERLRELLGRLEWAGTIVFDEWYDKGKCCPVCRGEQDDGHAPGCELAAAIRPTSLDPPEGSQP